MPIRSGRPNLRFFLATDGNVALLSAGMLFVVVCASALAVDVSMLYLERREAQSAVDLAALAAAADLANAETAAAATVAANKLRGNPKLQVVRGQYDADPSLAAGKRFTAGAAPANAVRVTMSKRGTTYFANAFNTDPVNIGVTAVGASNDRAAFALGSRLASVHDGIPNAVLGALVGGSVSLSVMDYNALAQANVALGTLLNAAATVAGMKTGTYSDVLNANLTLKQAIQVLANVSSSSGQPGAATALSALAATASSSMTLRLAKVIDLGPLARLSLGSASPGLATAVDVMTVLNGAAVVANGKHQFTLALGASIPGIAKLAIDVAIGEPMQHSGWVSVGYAGSMIYTAQTRLRVTADIAGAGLVAGSLIHLPLAVDVAFASGRAAGAACSGGTQASVAVVPGIVKAWIGDTAQLATWPDGLVVTPASLLSTSLLKVTAKAAVSAGGTAETLLTFDQADVTAGKVKTVDTGDIASSLVSTLLANSTLNAQVLGLSLVTPAALQSAVAATLKTAATPLDDVLHSLLEALGMHLGEADVKVYGIRCGGGVLGG